MDPRLEELKEKVKKGSISAAFALAEAWKWGYYGTPSDPRRAARMYRICCHSKNKATASRGYYNLGVLYYFGLCETGEREKEIRLAFSCFLKSNLLYPNREALCRLGDMYRYGQYVEKDEKIALSLYLKANASA